MHSFRDAEHQPVVPTNAKKNHGTSPKKLRPGINVSFLPLTTVYQAMHIILMMPVNEEAVNVCLEI